MKSKTLFGQSLFFACMAGVAASALIIFLALGVPSQGFLIDDVSAKSIQSITPFELTGLSAGRGSVGLPIRLQIPKIKVNAVLESVGITPDGAIGIPSGPTHAAWFNLGMRPGESGSAVITGHYGVWKSGLPTVFNNLYKLRKGDKVYVKDNTGAITTFVVRGLRTFGENDSMSDVFDAGDDLAHLNLITCQGVWNRTKKSYSERLVVFTDKE